MRYHRDDLRQRGYRLWYHALTKDAREDSGPNSDHGAFGRDL